MAWKSYEQWLKDNKLSSSEGNAANWKRQYGPTGYTPNPALAQPAAPAPAPAPVFTPPPPAPNWADLLKDTDALGQAGIADNKLKYGGIRDNATASYKQWALQNYGSDAIGADGKFNPNAQGGQVARINRNTTLGVQQRQNNAAARGMMRSGNRVVQEGRVRTEGADQLTDLSNEHDRQQLGMNQTIGQATTDEAIANNQANYGSAQRKMGDWWQRNGAGTWS